MTARLTLIIVILLVRLQSKICQGSSDQLWQYVLHIPSCPHMRLHHDCQASCCSGTIMCICNHNRVSKVIQWTRHKQVFAQTNIYSFHHSFIPYHSTGFYLQPYSTSLHHCAPTFVLLAGVASWHIFSRVQILNCCAKTHFKRLFVSVTWSLIHCFNCSVPM